MMEVAFTFGFDFLRASHSRVNTVMCTPGALSAYRTSAVMPILDQWLNETFLGKPYCIGEDRYLTNLILEQGYHILFQSNAHVFTNTPTKYKGLVRMLLRWARSDIRESLYMHKFVFKKFRQGSALGCRVNLALSWVDMTASQLLLVSGMISLLTLPPVVALYTLIGAAVVGLVPLTVYLLRHRSWLCLWAIPYSVFYVAALAWIPVYAIVTVHKSGWLTRQIRPESARRPWLQVARLAPAYAAAGLLAMLLGSGAFLKVANLPPLSDLPQMAALPEQGEVQGQAVAFTHTEDGVARWRLAATGSSLDRSSGVVGLRGVEVVFFAKNGQEVRISGDEAEFDPSDQSLALEGNVRGTTFNGLRLATNSLVYYDDERLVQTDDEVFLSGPSFRMRGHGFCIDMAKSRTVLKKPVTSRVSAMNQSPTRLAYLGS
jgi:LPS export ABC transporter protein LptC